jgi:hypothetical protein
VRDTQQRLAEALDRLAELELHPECDQELMPRTSFSRYEELSVTSVVTSIEASLAATVKLRELLAVKLREQTSG